MLKGSIININSTKYLVDTEKGIIDCTLRGLFRKEKITPLVGDIVDVDEENRIAKVYERKNYLTRPNISNVDIALIITSVKKPDLDLNLLDKLLVHVLASKIKPVIVFTKMDLLTKEEIKEFEKILKYYLSAGYEVITSDNLAKFYKVARKKILVCCGQTGAGKSSFINKIDSTLNLETKPISEALNRGVHTTRYVSLYKVEDFYIADTPGFSALDVSKLSKEDIKNGFIEFSNYTCKYKDCDHIKTDGCAIEPLVGTKILSSRYENYTKFIKEQNESSGKLFKK